MAHKININSKEYEIPERLTLDQYGTLLAYDWQDPTYYPMIVSQLTGAPIDLMSKADDKALTLAMALIIQLMNRREEVEMMDLSDIKFGQFIDLDVYLSLGIDKHLNEIVELLCPKAKWSDQAMWAIEKFAQFRIFTYRQYKVLFGITDKEIDTAIENSAEPVDKMYVARSWYKVIVSLAADDLLKIDRVTEEPLKKALNFMAYQKEKVLEAQEKERQNRRKYDLLRHR